MDIQDIALSHNKKKKLLKLITDTAVLFEDENGELVLNVAAYQELKLQTETQPIEDLLAEEAPLDTDAQYIVFS